MDEFSIRGGDQRYSGVPLTMFTMSEVLPLAIALEGYAISFMPSKNLGNIFAMYKGTCHHTGRVDVNLGSLESLG